MLVKNRYGIKYELPESIALEKINNKEMFLIEDDNEKKEVIEDVFELENTIDEIQGDDEIIIENDNEIEEIKEKYKMKHGLIPKKFANNKEWLLSKLN